MQKGFTLLEMLIALFIISLLLTLALPAYGFYHLFCATSQSAAYFVFVL
nr:prepilin-type N-terminal cleavage/methylation domain-containing protein [Aggregatibacter actinomycetemcomitans]